MDQKGLDESKGEALGGNEKGRESGCENEQNNGNRDRMRCTVDGHAHHAMRFIDRFRIRMKMGERSRRNCQKGECCQEHQKVPSNAPEEITHRFLPLTTDTVHNYLVDCQDNSRYWDNARNSLSPVHDRSSSKSERVERDPYCARLISLPATHAGDPPMMMP